MTPKSVFINASRDMCVTSIFWCLRCHKVHLLPTMVHEGRYFVLIKETATCCSSYMLRIDGDHRLIERAIMKGNEDAIFSKEDLVEILI